MNIHNAHITVSAVKPTQYPKTGVPEFAFVGRSNVGKSSLINKILNRKSLARVSSTPGKTITINFYDIDESIFLVDLPGYGYAKRSQNEIREWGDMIESYLSNRPQLKQIFLLVDSRHIPTKDDIMMLEWIRTVRPDDTVIAIATKTDKLKKSEKEFNLNRIYEKLELTEDDILVPFSTKGDEDKNTVWDMINMILAG
ncbi:MAG: ribosome biogenesis GTP-binding protein YihA/YsxC [Clostridia bacterium]|nr:ribosome biogenesis GTP-binding protein YihA/YsxC [Clostridia bacterium]